MRLIISCLVVAAFANTASAESKERRAKRHVDKATKAYQKGNFEDARKEFATAYSIDPQPQLLFALGDVNVKLGRCEAAVTFLHKYLETSPEESQATAANEALAKCNAPTTTAPVDEADIEIDTPGAKKEPVPAGPAVAQAKEEEAPPGITTPPPRQAPVQPGAETPQEGPSERAWYLEPVGLALCGGGVLAAGASVVLYTVAVGKNNEAELTTTSYENALSLSNDAKTLQYVSIASAVVGGALVGVGGYYFYRQKSAHDARVTAAASPQGAMIGLAGRF